MAISFQIDAFGSSQMPEPVFSSTLRRKIDGPRPDKTFINKIERTP
jgi:hypothetical protein